MRWTTCQLLAWTLVASMLETGVAVAQPPFPPDPRPKAITPDDLDRAIGGPTLVTLKFTDTRPDLVFASLAKQAGVHLHAYESTATLKKLPAMSVDLKDVPCMVALKTLSARLGLNFTLAWGGSPLEESPTGLVLRVEPAGDPQLRMEGPTLVRGPFVVIATSVQRARTISLSEPAKDRPAAARDDLWIDFVILADPKLLKHELLGEPTFYDAGGWTFRSIDREGMWSRRASFQGSSPVEWRFSAHRRGVPADSPRIPVLKALATRLHVTTKSEAWEVRDILKTQNATKEVTLAEGKRRYTIQLVQEIDNPDFSRRGAMFAVHLGVSGVGITKGKWSGWPEMKGDHLNHSFRLLDADGNDFAPYGQFKLEKFGLSGKYRSGHPRGVGKVATGDPVRAIWKLPTEIRAIEIPIEFANLPLP